MQMPIKTLEELFRSRKSGNLSDKWTHYLRMYELWLGAYRNKKLSLLEIGVQNGGSLEIWADYFANAEHIFGIDVDRRCADLHFGSDKIEVLIGSASESATQKRLDEKCRLFDIIIDDGSHLSSDIVRTFVNLFNNLRDGGIYIAEDLHASYWAGHGGGLYHPFSSISFFKRLADAVNAQHWLCDVSVNGAFAGFEEAYGIDICQIPIHTIQSISFSNSMCAIIRDETCKAGLGQRISSGQAQEVVPFSNHFEPPDQLANSWSMAAASPDKALPC